MYMKQTGYPSIDKPWLKYYSEEAINENLPECTVYEYLYENNKDHLQGNAIAYFGRKITYGELFENIDKVAIAFQKLGVKQGSVVTVVSLSCVTSILCFYALNKIGAVSNYINVLSTQDEIEQYLLDADSKYVVSLDLFAEKVLEASKRTNVEKLVVYSLKEFMPKHIRLGFSIKMSKFNDDFLNDNLVIKWNDFIKLSKGDSLKVYTKDYNDVCILSHTGGTTGFPKTILLNDFSLNAIAHQYYLTFERERGQKFLNILIPFVVYGLCTCMHMPLSLGLCLVVIPKLDDTKWSTYIKKYRPDFVGAVPSFITPMLKDSKLKNVDMSCFKWVAVGGDGMNEALEQELNEFFKQHNSDVEVGKGYGMSEVCASAITGRQGVNKIGSVGIPLVKNNIKIVDTESNNECTYGEIGELSMLCPSLMLGYKDNEEATNELVRVHSDGKKWLHTGDLAYVDEDGFVFLVGRIKRIIMTTNDGMGYKVFPNIIEEEIKKNSNVFEVCVIGATQGNNQVLRACIVLKKDAVGREKQVETQLRDTFDKDMPEYQRPTFYEFMDELPLTAVGKVDYKTLEENY